MKKIEIVEYDPDWPIIYEQEAKSILDVFENESLKIHHFGSTAVPGLAAKPKIDILLELETFDLLNIEKIAALQKLGFEFRGEIIPTGRYFSKNLPKIHLHVFEKDNPLIARNLTFRDFLRKNPEVRKKYEELKYRLACEHTDGMEYCHAKTDFIASILSSAF